jgi:hypothetical protein
MTPEWVVRVGWLLIPLLLGVTSVLQGETVEGLQWGWLTAVYFIAVYRPPPWDFSETVDPEFPP